MEHYLDNSATTQVLRPVAERALELMVGEYGNPSSLHTRGFRARQRVEEARALVAQRLGAQAEEITFTSGGHRRHRGQQPGPFRRGPGPQAPGEQNRHHRGGTRFRVKPLPGIGEAGL